MPAQPRHSKPKAPAARRGVSLVAAAMLAGVAAAFVFLHGGAASAGHRGGTTPAGHGRPVTAATTATSELTSYKIKVDARYMIAARQLAGPEQAIRGQAAARRLAAQRRAAAERRAALRRAAARQAAQQAAQQASAQPTAAATPSATPAPAPAPAPTASSSGADAAHSPLGACIRNAEEGGSYAWGPGNGGGAYQFQLSTWENYGGAASEFGVAGPAYQDQIFDNAIAAGGASNWTAYDGC